MKHTSLHVCYVITRSDVMGGASVHLLDLASGMQNAGHQVTILVGGMGIVNEKAKALGLNCYSVPELVRPIHPFYDLRCFFALKRWFKKLRPSIIHLHSSKAGLIGRLAAAGFGVPVVFTAHGWSFTEGVSAFSALLYRNLERWVSPLTDKIITVSEYDRQRALKLAVAPEQQMQTIHNGMPALMAATGHRHWHGGRIIMVARFEQPKDHQLLLQAAALLQRPFQLQLVGDGPLLAEAKQTAQQLQLLDKVEFCGSRNDVAALLQQADIFVLASRWEGLPLTILEAMRAALPVVASNVGGVSEAVEHHQTGICVPHGDAQLFANALQQLLDSPNLALQWGQAGQQKFLQQFTFDKMLGQTQALYQQLLGSRL